jgi:hypothetical protein
MTPPPVQPKIYHITHVDNLASMVASGFLESDGRRLKQGDGQTSIGMTEIKRRRLFENDVPCHPGTKVGEYVPFYFCPRSIMLYILHMGNLPDITYHGGQGPILHLQADMEVSIHWAEKNGVHWAFSDRNAGTRFTSFYKNRGELDKIDWNAVKATVFRDSQVKEGKQAEFLLHDACPWHLVEKISVIDAAMQAKVNNILQNTQNKPVVTIERAWYY